MTQEILNIDAPHHELQAGEKPNDLLYGQIDFNRLLPMAMQLSHEKAGETFALLKEMYLFSEDQKVKIEEREAKKSFYRDRASLDKDLAEIVILKNGKANITTRSGGSFSYSYAKMDEIIAKIRPVLSKNNFSVSFVPETTQNGMVKVTCVLQHADGHHQSVSLEAPEVQAIDNKIQAKGGTITFLQRYTLNSLLGLSASDDTDAVSPNYGKISPQKAMELFTLSKRYNITPDQFGLGVWADATDEIYQDIKDKLASSAQVQS